MAATNSSVLEEPGVHCERCASVFDHPFGHHPRRCPNCGRVGGPGRV